MKIEQKFVFQPVVVTLDSLAEVITLRDIARKALSHTKALTEEEEKFASQIAGFCSRAAEKGAL